MKDLSNSTREQLILFNQRKLSKGEIFILAKAISEKLPLISEDEDNVKLFILNHKSFICDVIYCINNYSYIGQEEENVIFKLIGDLTLWRASVAYQTPVIVFRGSSEAVAEDISGILRFIDASYICAVGDIAENSNYILGLFSAVVKEVKAFSSKDF